MVQHLSNEPRKSVGTIFAVNNINKAIHTKKHTNDDSRQLQQQQSQKSPYKML